MKVGTIGTSMITDRVMSQMLEYGDYKYEAIYSRKKETARYLQNKYNVDKVYTNLDEMLLDQDIDCVYVASPNSLHFEHAKKAMEAKKNVILEKPFCTSVKECEELIKISKKNKCFLFEAITTIHNPNYQAIKEMISKIGQVKVVECNLSKYSSKYDEFLKGKKSNVFSKEFFGGALMDINVYNIHFVVGLFGMPNSVEYFGNYKMNIDTSGILILKYNDFIVSCIGSKDCNGRSFCQIQGEKGLIYVNGMSSRVNLIEYHSDKEGKNEINLQNRKFPHYYYLGEILKIIKNQDYETCYRLLDHSLMVMNVLEMARKKAKT